MPSNPPQQLGKVAYRREPRAIENYDDRGATAVLVHFERERILSTRKSRSRDHRAEIARNQHIVSGARQVKATRASIIQRSGRHKTGYEHGAGAEGWYAKFSTSGML
jgi:hypothetical protein